MEGSFGLCMAQSSLTVVKYEFRNRSSKRSIVQLSGKKLSGKKLSGKNT